MKKLVHISKNSNSLRLTFRDGLIIAAALISVLMYVLTMHTVVGSAGFPLDDSWIHQTYGRNVALTGRWEYVPGVPSAGSTSPLYTLLLALGYFLRLPYFAWTYGLGAAALALAGLIAARIADQIFTDLRTAGLWCGLALVMAWHLVWAAASGMETMLFGALSLLLIYIAWWELPSLLSPLALLTSTISSTASKPTVVVNSSRKREMLHGVVFGLTGAALIATRPEGILLVGLLVVLMVIAHPQATSGDLMNWLIGAVIGGAIGVTPYALLNLSLNGQLLPNTFSAKQAENAPLLAQPFIDNLRAMITPLSAGGQLFLIPGALWATLYLLKRTRLRTALLYLVLLLWPVLLILLYTLRLPAYYQHGRYVIPALPPLIILGVGGTLWLLQYTLRKGLGLRVLGQTLAGAAVALFIVFWWQGAGYFARDVQMINSDMVVAANWLQQNVPSDQLLAVHDIGAVGYFAPRPIFDLAGLISPEIIPVILDPVAVMKMMEAKGVHYLMVLPSQRPTIDDPRLCELFNAHGQMGGMTIYKLTWDGNCPR